MARRTSSCRHIKRVLTVLACGGILALSTGTTAGAASPSDGGVAAAAPAFPEVGTMLATPLSGPPGSSISVSSVTGCPPLPTDPAASQRVDLTLVQGTTTIASASFPADGSGGAWQGSLSVDPGATTGEAVLSAFCIAGPQAEGAAYAYADLTFTVTAPAAELARTGASSSGLAATGAALLLVGVALSRADRRRARAVSGLREND